jgi:TetR/AcrR family transcriptional repressor of nem operon
MPKPPKRDQLVEATKELLWEVGYESMSPCDILTRSAAKPPATQTSNSGRG